MEIIDSKSQSQPQKVIEVKKEDSGELKNISEEEVISLKSELRKMNPTELIAANIRNVLFVGASRSGKSTSFNVFLDPCYCPENASMFSQTTNTVFRSFSIKNNTNTDVWEFILNLIDTPGTFEIRVADDQFAARSNDEICKLIASCLEHEVVYLNAVAMFMTISSSVSERAVDSIDLFMTMFGYLGLPVILCLTHADKNNKLRRDEILTEIQQYPRLKKYFDDKQLEILFMGCVDHRYEDCYDVRVLRRKYAEVFAWRSEFLNRIFRADERVYLSATQMYQDRKRSLVELLGVCTQELLRFRRLEHFDTSGFYTQLEGHEKNMHLIYEGKVYLKDDKEEIELFTGFWNELKLTWNSEHIPEPYRIRMVAPWQFD